MSIATENELETPLDSPSAELPAWSFWGTLASAIAAQACCGLPWLLLALGASSTSIGYLEVLKPWRPLFVLGALGFLLAGSLQLWQARQRGYACKVKPARKR
ncbi:MAG: mercuric transporter MerT family protein [Candidatus Sericytochromatia bacterium]